MSKKIFSVAWGEDGNHFGDIEATSEDEALEIAIAEIADVCGPSSDEDPWEDDVRVYKVFFIESGQTVKKG